MSTKKNNFKNLDQVLEFFIDSNLNSKTSIDDSNPDFVKRQMQLIKRLNLEANAKLIQFEQDKLNDLSIQARATELASKYLNEPTSTIKKLLCTQSLTFQFNKLEDFNKVELNEILIDFFKLKISKEENVE